MSTLDVTPPAATNFACMQLVLLTTQETVDPENSSGYTFAFNTSSSDSSGGVFPSSNFVEYQVFRRTDEG
jgi:hypothetical protein